MKTVYVIIAIVVLPFAYDIYTLFRDDLKSISEVARWIWWRPFLAYIISMVAGHIFISPPDKYTVAGYIGETGELFIVVFVGWSVFWYFYGNRSLLPLSNLEMLLVLLIGFLIGSFVWTMGA